MASTEQAKPGDSDVGSFGERLRAERERQKIGVRELSRRLEISASMISQIERGRVMPSVNTLYSITTALGISLDELFATGEQRPPRAAARGGHPLPQPVRHDAREALELGSGVRWELLTSEPDAAVDFLRTIYDVGGESTPARSLMRHGGHEYGVVVAGTLAVTVGFETFELGPGDSISFDSSTPHRLFNPGDRPAEAIWFVVGRHGDPRSAVGH